MSWNALIIGLGQIGMGYDQALDPSKFVFSHARALMLHPDFNLVAAVDPDEGKRLTFRHAYAAPAYADIGEALSRHVVDLAIIATPTKLHYETLTEVLRLQAPKAVLCEKPLSYELPESRLMRDLCAKSGVGLYVNYMRWCEPGAMEIMRRIHEHEIVGPFKGVAWYSKGFLHNGSHLFNLLEHWLGNLQSFALIDRGRDLPEGDAEPDVRVSFKRGQIVFLAAKNEDYSHNAIELITPNGRLRYENGGRQIEWSSASADNELKDYTFLAATPEEIPSQLNRYQWYVVKELANALQGRKAQLCSGDEALATLGAMHSILNSR